MSKNPRTRVYRSSKTSKAALEMSEDTAVLAGDSRHLVVVDSRGTTIKGPISIIADAMGVRRGALFVGINDFVHMIPSTMMTPIPQQIPFPPVHGLTNLATDVAFFTSLLI